VSVLVLDTDIASLSHKRRLTPTMRTRLATSLVCVTFVTVGELTRWEELYDWGPRRRSELAGWLRGVVKLPYDERTAYAWGRLSAAARKRGRPIADNDTWIAASCLARGLPLATGNVRHFTDFAEHHGLVLVTD
jgi:predicted nucleic acid-binding protein